MIRAVVFDLWNTLVHSRQGDPFSHLRELMTEAQREHFQDLKRDAMVQPHADAATFLERWRYTLRLTEPQFQAMCQTFREAEADAECYPEVAGALLQTRRTARTALLSNTQSFDMAFLERLGPLALIPARFLSAAMGCLKPDPGAFEGVQRRLGLFPGELAMVGDSWHDDVLGAHRAGWTAIWVNRRGAARPPLDPEADLVEVPDLSRVPQAIENLQAGGRCATCLG
jgi:HAD superfamily hydrolase (TIGR01493 family)